MCHHSEIEEWRERIETEHDDEATEAEAADEEPAPDVELLTDGGGE